MSSTSPGRRNKARRPVGGRNRVAAGARTRALRGSRRRLAGRAEVALAELVRMKADVDRVPHEATAVPTFLHRTELTAIESETRTRGPPSRLRRSSSRAARTTRRRSASWKSAIFVHGQVRVMKSVSFLISFPRSPKGALYREARSRFAVGLRAQPSQSFDRCRIVGDHVRPELRNDRMQRDLARGHRLDDRRRLARRDVLVGSDDDARLRRREPPALIGTVDVPLPLHAHVGVKDNVFSIRRERDQEMLAVRLDRLHRAADDLSSGRGWSHLRRDQIESGHDTPGKGATQNGRRAKDLSPSGIRRQARVTRRR